MALSLFKRLIKGSALTATEHDENMTAIENHTHGDIGSDGAISSPAITPASGDFILLSDASAGAVIKKGTQLGSSTTTYLRNNGTWGTPPNTVYTHPIGDGNLHVPATGTTNAGKVLTAGATEGSLSWETPTGGAGGSEYPQYPIIDGTSAIGICPYAASASTTTGAPTAGYLYMIPIVLDRGFNMNSLMINVSTAQAGSTFQIGIYDSDSSGNPTNIIASSTNLDASTTGTKMFPHSMTLLANKVYWLALTTNSSGTVATLRALTTSATKPVGLNVTGFYNHFRATSYTEIPATAPALSLANLTIPVILIEGTY